MPNSPIKPLVANSESLTPFPHAVIIDENFHLRLTPDVSIPMLQHGAVLCHLGSGWHFQSLYSGFAPVLLFELQHDSGHRATWFFDCSARFLGHAVADLPKAYKNGLVCKATMVIRRLLSQIIGQATKESGEDSHNFFSISNIARRQLSQVCCDMLLPPVSIVQIAEIPEMLMMLPMESEKSGTWVLRKHLSTVFTVCFQARLISALRDGYLSWPSPIDGTYQPSSGSFALNDFDFAYRMQDTASGLVYFLLVTQHVSTVCGLYFPSEGLLIVKDEQSKTVALDRFLCVSAMIVDHVCQFGETLLPYLQQGPKRIGAFLREQHIGHQLWNELSGLDVATQAVEPEQLPDILVLGGCSNEFFGPIDQIFPELSGKVQRNVQTLEDSITYTHKKHLLMVRITSDFISKKLRERILGHVRSTRYGLAAEATRPPQGGPIIVVGLRVENRTVVDLGGFLCRLLAHIASIAPGSHVVLDGQNGRENSDSFEALGSFANFLAVRPPLEVELELCRHIMDTVSGKPLTVTSTSGQPVASSIAWADASECFISLWGAGLSKYRWVTNKPGLILTNRDNLLRRSDLLIYNSPKFMADPRPMYFADPETIIDDPEAAQVIPIRQPSYFNFHVDETIFFDQVTKMILMHLSR